MSNDTQMKVLFVARAYPPQEGGMERFASDFYNNYKKIGEIELLANTGGNKSFLAFLFKVLAFIIVNARKFDVIHFSDAILSPFIPIIRIFSNAKISFTVHGLDIVYPHYGYQVYIPYFLKKADKIIAVSNYTKMQCLSRGIPDKKIMVIPNCLKFDKVNQFSGKKKTTVLSKFNITREGKIILLTIGRLIKRKGHVWFLQNVFINLPNNYIYIIAGCGPEQGKIIKTIHELGLTDKVYVLGRITDEEKNCLYQVSNLFIMPNIKVVNDQEGFGIVIIEAGSYGLPVIATNIEGISDAVIEGKTGRLIEDKDSQGFIDAIIYPNINNESIKKTVAENFDAENIIRRYYEEFKKMISNKD